MAPSAVTPCARGAGQIPAEVVPEQAAVHGPQQARAFARRQRRQRPARIAGVHPDGLDRRSGSRARFEPVAAVVGGNPEPPVGGTGVNVARARRQRGDRDAQGLRQGAFARGFGGDGNAGLRFPGGLLAGRPFDFARHARVVQGQARAAHAARQGQQPAHGKIRKGIVQPAPGSAAVERPPDSETIGREPFRAVPACHPGCQNGLKAVPLLGFYWVLAGSSWVFFSWVLLGMSEAEVFGVQEAEFQGSRMCVRRRME